MDLKVAEIDVIVPARGTEKASVPVTADKSIIVPVRLIPVIFVPNPTRLTVPIKPPRPDTKITGVGPEENGMIEPVATGGVIHAASTPIKGPSVVHSPLP